MNKNQKQVVFALLAVLVILVCGYWFRDVHLRPYGNPNCGDGTHITIDMRDFETQYTAYTLKLEANIGEKTKISTELEPKQLEQLSEAVQSTREFRKYVVAGYNSCAVTKIQYSEFGQKFQTLDSLAREINELTMKASLSQAEKAQLAGLIKQYGELSKSLSSK